MLRLLNIILFQVNCVVMLRLLNIRDGTGIMLVELVYALKY